MSLLFLWPKGERLSWLVFHVRRMNRITDIYFVGGFGTVSFLDVEEYRATKPDAIVLNDPAGTLRSLTEQFKVG